MKEKAKIKNFRDLYIWQQSMELTRDVYNLSSKFPREETYGLLSQIKRCAISIPSNIAEGFNRYHNKKYRHFLYITLGSCSELEMQIELSYMVGFLTDEIRNRILDKISLITGMTRNLLKKMTDEEGGV